MQGIKEMEMCKNKIKWMEKFSLKTKKIVKTKISEYVQNNKNTINQENGQDKTHITVAKIIPK